MPESFRCGIYFKTATRPVPVENFLRRVGTTRLDTSDGPQKNKQTFWFPSKAAFDRELPGIIESINAFTVHHPIPVFQAVEDVLPASEAEAMEQFNQGQRFGRGESDQSPGTGLFFNAGLQVARLQVCEAESARKQALETVTGSTSPDQLQDAFKMVNETDQSLVKVAEESKERVSSSVEQVAHNHQAASSTLAPAISVTEESPAKEAESPEPEPSDEPVPVKNKGGRPRKNK